MLGLGQGSFLPLYPLIVTPAKGPQGMRSCQPNPASPGGVQGRSPTASKMPVPRSFAPLGGILDCGSGGRQCFISPD